MVTIYVQERPEICMSVRCWCTRIVLLNQQRVLMLSRQPPVLTHPDFWYFLTDVEFAIPDPFFDKKYPSFRMTIHQKDAFEAQWPMMGCGLNQSSAYDTTQHTRSTRPPLSGCCNVGYPVTQLPPALTPVPIPVSGLVRGDIIHPLSHDNGRIHPTPRGMDYGQLWAQEEGRDMAPGPRGGGDTTAGSWVTVASATQFWACLSKVYCGVSLTWWPTGRWLIFCVIYFCHGPQ